MKLHYYFTIVFLLIFSTISNAQNGSSDLQLVLENANCASKKVVVKLQLKASHDTSTFLMGDGTLRFDYNLTQLINPVLKTQHNFSSSATTPDFNYGAQVFGKTEAGNDGIATISISYLGLAGGAKNVGLGWIDVASIEFDLISTNNCIDLLWHDNNRFPSTGMNQVIAPGTPDVVIKAIPSKIFTDLSTCSVLPLPTVALSANPASITSGSSSTLTVSLTAGTKPWSAMLSNGSQVTSSNNNSENFTVSPTATTAFSVTSVTDACGTTTYATNAPTATVTVTQPDPCLNAPAPAVTLSASPASVTSGSNSTLTVSLTAGTKPWSAMLSNGSQVTNSANNTESISVSPTATTTFSVTSVTDACGTTTYTTNAPTATVTVNQPDPCLNAPAPAVTLSASPASVTSGSSSTLTVSLTAGTKPWSAMLSNGSQVTNSANNTESISVSPTATTTFSVTSVTDACGTTTYATNAPTATVTVTQPDPCLNAPTPAVTLSASPASVTSGSNSTLTVSLTAGTKPWSAMLSNGSQVTNSANNTESISVSPTATTTFSVTSVTDACGTTTYTTNAPTATVTVTQPDPCLNAPAPTVTLSANPASITSGSSSTLTVSLTAGTKPWSAMLSNGSQVTNSANNTESISVSPTATTTFSVASVTDACGTTTYTTNAPTATVTVTQPDPCLNAPAPTATIVANPTSIVNGNSSLLTVALSVGKKPWSATLSNGSQVTSSNNNSENFTVSPTATTTFSVTSVTDACGTTTYTTNAPTATVTVTPIVGECTTRCLPITAVVITIK